MANFFCIFYALSFELNFFRLEFPFNNLFSGHSASIFILGRQIASINGSSDSKHQKHYGLHLKELFF